MLKFLYLFVFFIASFGVLAQSNAPSSAEPSEPTASPNATSCTAPKTDTALPPIQNAAPVNVVLGFFFTDILGVSDPDQNIQADIVQVMEWDDPRLSSLSGCFLSFTDVWTPRVELFNSSKLAAKYTQARNQVEVLQNGRVRYVQRYSGTISTYHDLTNFPFDKQVFNFRLVSPLYDASQVTLSPLEASIGIASQLNIEDWSFGKFSATSQTETLPSFASPHSVMTFELSAERHVSYYVFKVLIPLGLIVSMSWVVFWIKPSNFEAQIGFGATSMLTLIAFQFGLINSVPKLSYFTSMDYLVFGATVLVYTAILEALLTGVLYRRGDEAKAQRIDIFCRWAYPIAFVLFWIFVMVKSYT